ncbi:MAG: sodium:solute symporter [Candidatus Eremiobacteraeota bacterium]|nr:sodium:solute symporter [Candidatus Eremiobacteraeota bacterium]
MITSGFLIFAFLILAVTVMGFLAARWGSASLETLEQWALGGRGFGTIVSWFLLGGDLYTAYTFIAVPALVYSVGALGFFAVPYTTIAYPFVFLVMARFWVVAKSRGYVTIADFVRDRFGSRSLEVAIALTGFVAAMPYIALQLVGMQIVFAQYGGAQAILAERLALILAFAILAAYTYTSGLRAPALIAFVKDTLLYVTIIAAVTIIPAKLGGWSHIFEAAGTALATHKPAGSIILPPNLYFAYASLAFGSAMSLFLYPHSVTSLLSAKSKLVIQRNSALLPLYSILLALLALLGYCALAAGIHTKDANLTIPLLFKQFFPDWFLGIAYAAIVIGALVPAAIMAIGAANLFASNVFQQFQTDRPAFETRNAKFLCLGICAAGLMISLFLKVEYAIYLQLLGGSLMLQTFPSTALGLYTRWFHPKALLSGWAVGIAASVAMAIATGFKGQYPLHIGGSVLIGYIGLYALVLNLFVAVALTYVFRSAHIGAGHDNTMVADYV